MLIALLLAFTVAQAAAQATVRRTPPSQDSGTIRGRITERDTGRTLPHFRVSVSVQPLRSDNVRIIATTTTNDDGTYELANVPPGNYLITALPPEHVATHLAQMHGYDEPLALLGGTVRGNTSVRAGGVLEVNIPVQRSLAIEGAVTTQEGDPIANASVSIERIDRRGAPATVLSDDLGRYRHFGLSPGAYRVCAAPGAMNGPGERGSPEALVKTCLPAADSGTTGVLELRSADLRTAHVTMQRVARFSVSGEVLDSYGAALDRGEIAFIAAAGTQRSLKVARPAPGRFLVENVEAGKYTLRASVNPDRASDSRPRESGTLEVVVDRTDVERLTLRMHRALAVFGVVTFEGTPPDGVGDRVRIGLMRDPSSASAAGPADIRPVRDDWTFELNQVSEPVIISVDSPPAGWLVRAVNYRGRDVTGHPVELEASDDPRAIEVVLTNRVGHISGRASGAAPGRTVLVLAFNASRARSSALAADAAPSPAATGFLDAKSAFKLGPLLGGEYLVVAVDRDEWFDASTGNRLAALDSVIARAERVRVLEGEQPTLVLTVVPVR